MKYDIRDTKCGFTISELLMVVIIIALVGGVGGGLYVGTYKRIMVERAARDFVLTAKYARIIAIEKQKPYKLYLDDVNDGFLLTTSQWSEQNEQVETVIVKDLYCRPVVFQGEVKFEDIRIAPVGAEGAIEGNQAEQTEEEGQVITFAPNGSAQPAVVQICDGRTHYAVTISGATGKAKISFGTAENLMAGYFDLDAE